MLELLVAGLCLGQYNCGAATQAYLAYNPVPQKIATQELNHLKSQAVEYLGEQTVMAIGITAAIASKLSQRTYQVRISKHWSVGRVQVQTFNNFEYGYQAVYTYNF